MNDFIAKLDKPIDNENYYMALFGDSESYSALIMIHEQLIDIDIMTLLQEQLLESVKYTPQDFCKINTDCRLTIDSKVELDLLRLILNKKNLRGYKVVMAEQKKEWDKFIGLLNN